MGRIIQASSLAPNLLAGGLGLTSAANWPINSIGKLASLHPPMMLLGHTESGGMTFISGGEAAAYEPTGSVTIT